MKAIVVEERGGAQVLRCQERPRPEPGAGQLLIRTEYAGLNYADVMQREGRYPLTLPLPYVPGNEIVGIVEQVGDAVGGYAVGDRVAALMLEGGYAEYAAVSSQLVFPLAPALDGAAATALLVQGFTAYLLVRELVRAGDAVLVTAAGGGVGSIALQLARLRGARRVVGGVGSADKCVLVEELGGGAVAYDAIGWESRATELAGTEFACILDAVGGTVREAAYRVLAPFGRMGIYGNSSGQEEHWDAARWHALLMASQSVHGFAFTAWMAAHPDFAAEAFSYLAAAAAERRLRLPVHPTYRLDEAERAHRDLEARRTTGKVVLRM